MCTYAGMRYGVHMEAGGQLMGACPLSTLWVLEIKLRLSGSIESQAQSLDGPAYQPVDLFF